MSSAKRTPLHDFNLGHGARMVDFAGWEMPVQYASITEEHRAVRSAAGLFDVSHMGEAIVEGPQAEAFLEHSLSNDISSMQDRSALYSLMCNPRGGVVDDLLVYRFSRQRYLLCVNASNTDKDFAWLGKLAKGFDASLRDVSERYGLLALQGPRSFEILRGMGLGEIGSLGYFRFLETELAGSPCLLARTGYTGERGVEIFVDWGQAASLADAILEAGSNAGLSLAGLGARDSLRLEAGYSLYGHEIDEDCGPVEAGLMWTVKLDKRVPFIGQAAIAARNRQGPETRVIFFRTGGRKIARPGSAVLSGGQEIGKVLSGTFSPVLNESIGSAAVRADLAKSSELAIEARGKEMRISRCRPPFLPLKPQN